MEKTAPYDNFVSVRSSCLKFYTFLLLKTNTAAVLYRVECVSGYNTCSDLFSYLNHTRKVCEKYVISLNTNHGCNLMFCHFLFDVSKIYLLHSLRFFIISDQPKILLVAIFISLYYYWWYKELHKILHFQQNFR